MEPPVGEAHLQRSANLLFLALLSLSFFIPSSFLQEQESHLLSLKPSPFFFFLYAIPFKMYSDPIGVRRAVRDRLGSSFGRSPPAFFDHRAVLRRQSQDLTNWNGPLHGERNHVTRKFVPRDATRSKLKKDVSKSSRSIIVNAREGQKIALINAQTPKVHSFIESKGRYVTPTTSPKEPAAPTSGEKKYIVLNLETFLHKLGLSKYLVTFKAEEIDMYALKHMNDDDFKSIGLPMGPRKKILHFLDRLKSKKGFST